MNPESPPITLRSRYPSCASARKIRSAAASRSAGKEDANADHAWAAVRADDRPELTSIRHELGIVSSQLVLDDRRVRRRVGVYHAEPLRLPQPDHQLDQPPQGA